MLLCLLIGIICHRDLLSLHLHTRSAGATGAGVFVGVVPAGAGTAGAAGAAGGPGGAGAVATGGATGGFTTGLAFVPKRKIIVILGTISTF